MTERKERSALRMEQSPYRGDDIYESITQRLIARRAQLLTEAARRREATDVEPFDPRTASQIGAELLSISDALNRIRHRAYGACRSCTTPIELEKLRRYPLARLCDECQEVKRVPIAS